MGDGISLTREEKIQILQQRIENFKKELTDPQTFTYSLYNSNSPKKDHLRAWADTLADLRKLDPKKFKYEEWEISGIIRNELKGMGADNVIPYAKQVIPFKYKDSTKIHARNLLSYELQTNRDVHHPENLLSEDEITAINKFYISELEEDISLLRKCCEYLKEHVLVSKIDPYELDEWRTRSEGRRTQVYQAMDGRVKVMPETFHLLMASFLEATKSFTFEKYMTHIKNMLKLTPKQAIKLLSGRVTKVDILYEPKSRSDARMANFYGVRCGECGSWRVDLKYHPDMTRDMLFCYACKSWNEPKSKKLVSKLI